MKTPDTTPPTEDPKAPFSEAQYKEDELVKQWQNQHFPEETKPNTNEHFRKTVHLTGREDIMRDFIRMQADIKAGNPLTKHDADLIIKYGFKQLRGAKLNGLEFHGDFNDVDARDTDTNYMVVHGDMLRSHFSNLIRTTIDGKQSHNTVDGHMAINIIGSDQSENIIAGDQSWNEVQGDQSHNEVAGDQSRNKIAGEQRGNSVGKNQLENQIGYDQANNTVHGFQCWNKMGGSQSNNVVHGAQAFNIIGKNQTNNTIMDEAQYDEAQYAAESYIDLGVDTCQIDTSAAAEAPIAPDTDQASNQRLMEAIQFQNVPLLSQSGNIVQGNQTNNKVQGDQLNNQVEGIRHKNEVTGKRYTWETWPEMLSNIIKRRVNVVKRFYDVPLPSATNK